MGEIVLESSTARVARLAWLRPLADVIDADCSGRVAALHGDTAELSRAVRQRTDAP